MNIKNAQQEVDNWINNHPSNFNAAGHQKESLRNLTRLVLAQSDPIKDR